MIKTIALAGNAVENGVKICTRRQVEEYRVQGLGVTVEFKGYILRVTV